MMKILRHKNLMSILYCFLCLLPIAAIGVRSAYVICNKNAKDSYYGETINEYKELPVTTLKSGVTYYLNINTDQIVTNSTIFFNYELKDLYIPGYQQSELQNITDNSSRFLLLNNGTSNMYISFRDDNNTTIQNVNVKTTTIVFTFEYNTSTGDTTGIKQFLSYREYNNYSFLDNVFEYSINEFTNENNLGQIDMFSWFTGMFLSDNAHNNLYVGFANWYMNYVMLVSLMHIFFLVLMWFVQFVRRLLERGLNNYDW